ncbi:MULTISPECIES: IlvD/Edd family dehydratase [Chelativorans]|jgi:dihydroxy-acid dehydratase|uniref:Dihydroxyacid dehydratase n=1 Tax=Chelativorans sp. (strain BNC1) TaxID=266779 RepID=Q11AJ3_CHESB|nr:MULTISPECIES: IlvD/Edd family dehydratase [Chelativorans]
MTTGLKRGLTNYGDPEFSAYLRRAFIKAMGLSDDALSRPIVGITNTYSDFNPCHGNVPQLIEAVKRGVMMSGGLPMVFPTITLHESFAYPTSMFLRNLMAMDTEEMIRSLPVDSVVAIGGCDKTLPAQVMAMVSADRPGIVLPTGAMLTGEHRGVRIGACTDCRRFWASYRGGEIADGEISEVSGRLVPSVGTCSVMGTASTMAGLCEAMGLSLPYSGSIPAVLAERIRCAEETGRRAVGLAAEGLTPRQILSDGAIHNAMAVLQAMGGSTNAVIHLAAIAGRTGRAFDFEALDRLGQEIPVLVDLKPSGTFYMQDFHAAGGFPALFAELQDFLQTDCMTVAGVPLSATISGATDRRTASKVIRSRVDPISDYGAVAMLYGNLAPNGAVIKQSAASPELMQHEGRALVFDGVEDLAARIDDPDLDVEKDDILVLRNAGPIGGEGMPEAGYLPIPAKLARRGVKDMVRISDARMSGTGFGTIVLHIAPEAWIGGPLGLVRSGDRIRLDVKGRRLDLLVSDAELEDRRGFWKPVRRPAPRGYARLFEHCVTQADAGCDFDFLNETSSGTSLA